jgi:hypothetical protein
MGDDMAAVTNATGAPENVYLEIDPNYGYDPNQTADEMPEYDPLTPSNDPRVQEALANLTDQISRIGHIKPINPWPWVAGGLVLVLLLRR